MGYVKPLWRGDVALNVVFWTIYILSQVLFFGVNWLFLFVVQNTALSDPVFYYYTLHLCGGLYFLFLTVPVFRSARKYKGKTIYATLAILVCCVGFLRSILGIFTVLRAIIGDWAVLLLILFIIYLCFYLFFYVSTSGIYLRLKVKSLFVKG